ncbi:MAG TPA: hypothetical protein PKU91_08420 [Phycisphaerales bacterium]|nr:hypothetical protein [Phycisphaerales bacterium]
MLVPVEYVGGRAISLADHIGSLTLLFIEAAGWLLRGVAGKRNRIGYQAIVSQIARVGVRSIGIVDLRRRG